MRTYRSTAELTKLMQSDGQLLFIRRKSLNFSTVVERAMRLFIAPLTSRGTARVPIILS